jgi:hypothetical protein
MEEQVHKPHRKSKEKKKHTGGKNSPPIYLSFTFSARDDAYHGTQTKIPRLSPSPSRENCKELRQDPRMYVLPLTSHSKSQVL